MLIYSILLNSRSRKSGLNAILFTQYKNKYVWHTIERDKAGETETIERNGAIEEKEG